MESHSQSMEVKKDTVVDMELLEKLTRMSNEEDAILEWGKATIFRVPSHIKERNPAAYTPHLVSIGPYHHGRSELQATKKLKHRALSHWLKRHSLSFGDLITSLKPVVQQLMDCYEGLGEEWKDEERFLQLMALDGCFLLELAPKLSPEGRAYREADYPENDPVIGTRTVLSDMRSLDNDTLMIENQLPLMVLDRLLMLVPSSALQTTDNLHVLDAYRKLIVGSHRESPNQRQYPHFFSASVLKLAGVVFKRKTVNVDEEHPNYADIEFDKGTGTLTLPTIPLDPLYETRLLNAVAYERLRPAVGYEVRAYIHFLACLVCSVNDVQVLRSENIIWTRLSDDQKIVEFIQKLRYDVNYIPETCYERERVEMRVYCGHNMKQWRRRFRGWMLNLQETYFKSPWSIIALAAGTTLLGLAMAQTIFAAKGSAKG